MLSNYIYSVHPYRVEPMKFLSTLDIRLVDLGPLRSSARGFEGITGPVGIQGTEGSFVVSGLPITLEPVGEYPGIQVSTAGDYAGEWLQDVQAMVPLRAYLEGLGVEYPTLELRSLGLIRDEVRWKERIDGSVVEISTDVGLGLSFRNGHCLLVLARDSCAGIMHTVYTRTDAELAWWFSDQGVRHTWIFDLECMEVLHTKRTWIPL